MFTFLEKPIVIEYSYRYKNPNYNPAHDETSDQNAKYEYIYYRAGSTPALEKFIDHRLGGYTFVTRAEIKLDGITVSGYRAEESHLGEDA